MKPFIVHLLTLLAICFVLSCCKHEPPTEPAQECQYDNNIGEMKRWYYFKVGTWWVYQEETTGALDTITVYYNADGVDSGFDYFQWFGHSSYDGYDYRYRFNTSYTIHCLTKVNCDCHKVNRSKGMPGDFVGSEDLFAYPNIPNNYLGVSGEWGEFEQRSTLIEIHDSTSILGNTYYNVIKWEVSSDYSESHDSTEYYLSQDIGLVKFVLKEANKSWLLKEYFIAD